MTTMTRMVKVTGSHECYGRRNAWWVDPVGWEPKKPAEFADEQYTLDEGSVWGREEEECGLAYFGAIAEGETKEVPLEDLNWVYTGANGLQRLDVPFVEVA